mmetsp:Transcript_87618/g.281156  ORF Transcript_87618/g.281156 Transcript_87618/m.281156 type:complete len:300 (-) Transcript_87618:56-955(-)
MPHGPLRRAYATMPAALALPLWSGREDGKPGPGLQSLPRCRSTFFVGCLAAAVAAVSAMMVCQVSEAFAQPLSEGPLLAASRSLAGASQTRLLLSKRTRDDSHVTMGVRRLDAKRDKTARNIVDMGRKQALETPSFQTRRYKRQIRKFEKLSANDEKNDEFMFFSRPLAVGGQYTMPVETVRDLMKEIYGDEPSIKLAARLSAGDTKNMDIEELEAQRRKANPAKSSRKSTKAAYPYGPIPGVGKYIGQMPRQVPVGHGSLGVMGGSSDRNSLQDIFISGNSVSYAYENNDPLRHKDVV